MKTIICQSIKLCVCVCMCVYVCGVWWCVVCVCVCVCVCECVYLNLFGYISISIESKNYPKDQAEVVLAKGQPNWLHLLDRLHQVKIFILAGIFYIIDRNPGVGLILMIWIFQLK